MWSDGAALGTWFNWDTNQPNPANSANQDCVKIEGGSSGTWDDVSCNGAKKFVCESSVPSSTTTPANTCTTPTTVSSTVTTVTTPAFDQCETGWWHYAAGKKCVRGFSSAVRLITRLRAESWIPVMRSVRGE